MSDLRTAAQQALEAMEWHLARGAYGADIEGVTGNLRAALAQQAGPVQEPITRLFGTLPVHDTQQAEPVDPVAWVASKDGRVIYDDASTDDGLLRVSGDFKNDEQRVRYAQRIVDKLNAAPAQQAEPVEPVGWNWMLDGQPYGQAYYGNPPDTDIAERAAIAGRTVRLLYTAPPQRKPLTQEESDNIYREFTLYQDRLTPSVLQRIVRAIERAHGIT